MARSRSRGGTSLTRVPSIKMSPDVGSSNPATMRIVVVFPQPEGPSSTRNSRSAISRLRSCTATKLPKRLAMRSRLIVATSLSPDDEAAVDPQDLAGDEGGAVAGEEGNGLGHLLGLAEAADGMGPVPRMRSAPAGRRTRVEDLWLSGVMMVPGATALTRMPRGARSIAACWVSALMPPLAAA